MRWPQIVMIVCFGGNIGMALVKDGEPRDGKYSFFRTLISTAIEAAILYAGGFFN